MSFTWDSTVFFDELDPLGVMHNSRYAVHVERAQSACFEELGRGWSDFSRRHPDLSYVVRRLTIDFLAPVSAPGLLRIELTALRLGTTSATYGFVLGNGAGLTHATVERLIVKIDPDTGRPAAWTDGYREQFAELQAP